MRLSKIINILVMIVLSLLVFRQVYPSYVIDVAYIVLGVFFIMCELRFFVRHIGLFHLLAFLLLLMIGGRYIVGAPLGLLFVFNVALSFFIAHSVGQGIIKRFAGYYLFYLTTVIIVYNILIGGGVIEIAFGNRNTISWLMISSFVFLVIVNRQNLKSPPIIPALLVVVLSFWASSRSGIVASFPIMISIGILLFKNLKDKKTLQKQLITYGLIFIFGILAASFSTQIKQFYEDSSSRLIRKGFASPDRIRMTLAYFDQLTLAKTFFGSDLSSITEIDEQNTNPHSFYIVFHSVFGIVALVIYMLLVRYILKRFRNSDAVFGLIISAFFLRMSTDSGVRGIALFIFMMILFEVCASLRIEKKRGKRFLQLNGESLAEIMRIQEN